jgi:hypothetical protein
MDLEVIDMDWITNINIDEFEINKNTFIKVNFFYIKDYYLIRKSNLVYNLLNPNIITKEELIHLVNENNNYNGIQFTFVELNYIIFSEDIEDLKNIMKNNFNIKINKINMIDDIHLNDTISILQDLNELNIIFNLKK